MQPKNEAPLTNIGIPQHKAYAHMANRIILAKRNLRGDEVEVEVEDWIIQTAPKWFQPERLKHLCSGLDKDYRIGSVAVHQNRLTLQVIECLEEPSAGSELILIPKITEARFMLALYLAKVFDCLARIELYWRPNPTTSQSEFEVLLEDIDDRIVLADIPSTNLIELFRAELLETEDPATPSAQPAKTPRLATPNRPAKPAASKTAASESAKQPATKPPTSKTAKEPASSGSAAKAKAMSEETIAEIARKLEHKGLLKNGKASTTKWGLMDCANYIMVLSSVTENSALIQDYIDFFCKKYRLPSQIIIKEFLLGNTPASWIRTAREWLK